MKKIIVTGLCYLFFSFITVGRAESKRNLNGQIDSAALDSIRYEKVIQELDSLILISNKKGDSNNQAFLYHKKGVYQLRTIRYHEALESLKKAYELIGHVTDFGLKYSINLDLGLCYSFLTMLQESFPYFDNAYAYADSTGNPLFIARARHFTATKDLVGGEYIKASKKLYESYQVLMEHKDTTHLLYLCNDIGAFFLMIGNEDRSIEFFQKALHYDSLANTRATSFRAMILSNIGAVYTENIKDYKTAEKYFRESLASLRPRENWRDKFYAETYLATTQTYNGNYSEAKKYFEKAYNDDQVKNRTTYYPYIVTYYGINLLKLGYYQKAREISKEAYNLSLQLNWSQIIQLNLQSLYKLDSIAGNYKGAFTHYQSMISAQRSKLAEDAKMEFIRLEVEQEIEKMLSKTNELLAENKEHLGTIDRLNKLSVQQKVVILLFVLLAIALLIELVLNKRLTNRLKESEDALKLLNQNLENKVKERTKQLERAHRELHQLDDAKTEFLSIISHEIRTPLNGIVAMVGSIEISELPEHLKEFLEIIQISSDRLEKFSYKALEISLLITKGKDALKLKKGNLMETIESCINENRSQLIQKQLEFVISLNYSEIILAYDKMLLTKAISFILDNAIKFAQEKTQVRIEVLKSEKEFEIVITDIGELLPENTDDNQIRPFKTGFKHMDMNPGLSLYLSKLIIEAHGGRILLQNNVDGVTVRVILPAE